jgi:hypothetical protein
MLLQDEVDVRASKPKDDTAARRRPLALPVAASVWTRKGLAAKSLTGFGRSRFDRGGRLPWERARQALMQLTTPAAQRRCPTFALTDPREQ